LTPFDPVFTVDVIQFEVKFDVTIFELKFVEVNIPVVDIKHFSPMTNRKRDIKENENKEDLKLTRK